MGSSSSKTQQNTIPVQESGNNKIVSQSISQNSADLQALQLQIDKQQDYFNQQEENYDESRFILKEVQGDLDVLHCFIKGRKETLHEGAKYKLKIIFPIAFPKQPPTFLFENLKDSGPYHPNVSPTSGSICIENTCWKEKSQIYYRIQSIEELLYKPNFESPLNSESVELYKNNKQLYEDKVRQQARLTKDKYKFD